MNAKCRVGYLLHAKIGGYKMSVHGGPVAMQVMIEVPTASGNFDKEDEIL